MKRLRFFFMILLVSVLIIAVTVGFTRAQEPGPQGRVSTQADLTTAFTYQGRLTDGGNPANGTYDFRFILYDAEAGGSQVGSTVTRNDIAVTGGLFTVQLNFGSGAFDGNARWLETGVRPGSSTGAYTVLSPRQPLTAAPYALYSARAPWSGLVGVPAGFADGVDNDTTYSAGTGLTLSSTQFSLNTTYTDGRYWKLGGNSGTNPTTHFLGTTDNVTLTLAANGTAALRLAPTTGTPNLIGGYNGNSVTAGMKGAVIGGGGDSTAPNRVTADYGIVAGGLGNTASGAHATVSGGNHNTASGAGSAVFGGGYNTAGGSDSMVGGNHNIAHGDKAFIGGGFHNVADGQKAALVGGMYNYANGRYSSVGGGYYADAEGQYSVIGGGDFNLSDGVGATVGGGGHNMATADFTVVAGGGSLTAQHGNRATDNYGTICGGSGNQAGNNTGTTNDAPYATVCGGGANIASNFYATVGGGGGNKATGSSSTVGGGDANHATGGRSTVGGGGYNIASGQHSTVPGGFSNKAEGDFSFAAGRFARAGHDGSFVWADSQVAQVSSPQKDSFVVRAKGGIWFGINSSPSIPTGRFINTSTGAYLSTGGVWTNASDRNAKENFEPVNPLKVLDKLARMPVSTWNYKSQDASIRHMGPMAQDFYAAFGLGEDDKHIGTLDAEGVSMAAIKGLYMQNQEQAKRIAELESQNAELMSRLQAIEAQIEGLKAQCERSKK